MISMIKIKINSTIKNIAVVNTICEKRCRSITFRLQKCRCEIDISVYIHTWKTNTKNEDKSYISNSHVCFNANFFKEIIQLYCLILKWEWLLIIQKFQRDNVLICGSIFLKLVYNLYIFSTSLLCTCTLLLNAVCITNVLIFNMF